MLSSDGPAKSSVVLPWNTGNYSKNTRLQMKAAFKDNLLDHMESLDRDSEVNNIPLTKIICSAGPSNCVIQNLETLMDAGMNAIMLPMWLFSNEEKVQAIRNIREAVNNFSVKYDRSFPLGVGIDLRGPQIHTGRLFENTSVMVEEGNTLCLTTRKNWENKGTACKVYIDCKDLPSQLRPGTDIMIDTGTIILNVSNIVGDNDIVCTVIKGGKLFNNRIVHVIGTPLSIREIGQCDLEDIEFALQMGIDFIFISSVRFDCVIKEIRKILDFRKSNMLLVAKIESKIAVDNIEAIVNEADAICLVRNNLAIEISQERLFIIQDNVTAICKKLGKPMFIEGNMLRKTLHDEKYGQELEVTDIITSLQKGVDGFIMRDSMTLGLDPKKLMDEMVNLCIQAEPAYWHSHFFNKLATMAAPPINPAHAISIAVVEAAMKAGASAILVCTASGTSARLICRYLPRVPVVAITRYGRVARQLALYRSVVPYHYIAPPVKDWHKDIDLRIQAGIGYGKEKGFIKPGDPLVLLNGWRPGAGFSNTMRMAYASQTDPWVNFKDFNVRLPTQDAGCPPVDNCPYVNTDFF